MLKIPFPPTLSADPLDRLPETLRIYLREHGEVKQYSSGDTLVAAGDEGDRIRFLLSGEASVLLKDQKDEEIAIDTLRPGDMFGEISFLTGRPNPKSSELVADELCEVVEIGAKEFETLLTENHEVTLSLVRNLANKIISLDQKVYKGKTKRRALQALISREDHLFPDYVIGDYIKRRLPDRIRELAVSDGPVLILGETGVGKEVLAHAIFKMSHEHREVFLLLDLLTSRIPIIEPGPGSVEVRTSDDTPLEQMKLFFGAEETGPDGQKSIKRGYLELTDEGTLLVRGIEHLHPGVQQSLLHAVQSGRYVRVGGATRQHCTTRLIATSEIDPTEISGHTHPLVNGLLYRSITVPPLRNRRKEIPALVRHYLDKYCKEYRKDPMDLPKQTLKILLNYQWPGNDVELSGTLRRAVLVSEGGTLRPQDVYFDLKRVGERGKLNLLQIKPLLQAFKSPLYPAVLQSAMAPFFFLLLLFLFFGPTDPVRNPGALLSWAVGWPLLVIGAFLWARLWCTICPMGVLGNMAKKLISFDKPFPVFLRKNSDFVLAATVLLIIWFETATDIRNTPYNLGILLAAMTMSAIFISVVFERQSWCRYLCGLGGMVSVLAKSSLIELRADRNICISQCTSNDCFLGTKVAEGCPFGQAGPKLHSNRLCKLCGQCVKNCPHGAISLNLRIPGQEIWEIRHTNTGTAFLVIGMIGGLLTEMVSRMPVYDRITAYLPGSEMVRFTIVFIGALLIMNVLSVLAAALSHKALGDTFRENYSRFALALLPFVLTAFIAYHVYYLIHLGVQLPILMGEYFELHIFKRLIITVPGEITHLIQKILIYTGIGWSIFAMYRLSGAEDRRRSAMTYLGILPHAALVLIFGTLVLRAIEAFFRF